MSRQHSPEDPSWSDATASPEASRAVPAPTLATFLEELAREIAKRVVDQLRATDFAGYVDQSASPLGRRRHIEAVRSGRLPGVRSGRRYLVRREDLDRYVARQPTPEAAPRDQTPVDDLARELGLTRWREP